MKKIHETMKRVFDTTGKQPSEIAYALNTSPQSISNWSNRGISKKGAIEISEAFGIPVNFILTGQGEQNLLTNTKPVVGWDDSTPLDDDEFEVPHYAHVTVSAGDKIGEVQEITDRKIRMSKSSARKAGASITQSFSYNASGDSMEEKIADGARCTADKSKTELKDGKIYVFRHGLIRRTKYLYRLPNGGLLIKSHNPSYPDEFVPPDEMGDIEILGWVWEWSNMERW